MAIKYVTSFSHTHYWWPCHFVVSVGEDLSRDMTCVFKIGKITVCIAFVNFLQMLVLNVLVMG